MYANCMTNPYEGYKVYGPYLHAKEGRYYVQLVILGSKANHRTTLSYARYLMAMHLGRVLSGDEHVDHIDDNKLNDDLNNLQILTKKENIAKGRSRAVVDLICPNCGVAFTRDRGQTHLTNGRGMRTFCSRRCSGQYYMIKGKVGHRWGTYAGDLTDCTHICEVCGMCLLSSETQEELANFPCIPNRKK